MEGAQGIKTYLLYCPDLLEQLTSELLSAKENMSFFNAKTITILFFTVCGGTSVNDKII